MVSRARSLATVFLFAMAAASGAPGAARADPPAVVQREVEHLLAYTEKSGCEFYRNGFWFTAQEGQNHLRMKYEYLWGLSMINSAEDFVALAASRSSISGIDYQVRCAGAQAQPSASWLIRELTRFRAGY